jgi:hypothetical protein
MMLWCFCCWFVFCFWCCCRCHFYVAPPILTLHLPVALDLGVERSGVLVIAIVVVFHQSLISGSINQSTNQSSYRVGIGYPRKPCGFNNSSSSLLIKPPCILATTVAAAFRSQPRFWHLRIWQKIYRRNNPRSPCYFSKSSPTNPCKLISGRSRPPFSGRKMKCYSFAIILWHCMSSILRYATLPTGKDPYLPKFICLRTVQYRALLPWGQVYVSPAAIFFHLPQGTRFVPVEGRILTYSVQYLYSFVPTEAFTIR